VSADSELRAAYQAGQIVPRRGQPDHAVRDGGSCPDCGQERRTAAGDPCRAPVPRRPHREPRAAGDPADDLLSSTTSDSTNRGAPPMSPNLIPAAGEPA
jgi:hypothetical protein